MIITADTWAEVDSQGNLIEFHDKSVTLPSTKLPNGNYVYFEDIKEETYENLLHIVGP